LVREFRIAQRWATSLNNQYKTRRLSPNNEKESNHEKAYYNQAVTDPARPPRVAINGTPAADKHSLNLIRPGAPAGYTSLWIELSGMGGQMVTVEF
jgi:hypothetical protein